MPKLPDSSSQPRDQSDAPRLPYEPPRVLKKRSVARVTLATGTGATAAGSLGAYNP